MANGPCIVDGFLPSEDCLANGWGFPLDGRENPAAERERIWTQPNSKSSASAAFCVLRKGPIDCGNSGTTMRLLSGILSGQPPGFKAELVGDESLMTRPMRRVIEPLTIMGASSECERRRRYRADRDSRLASAPNRLSIARRQCAGEKRRAPRLAFHEGGNRRLPNRAGRAITPSACSTISASKRCADEDRITIVGRSDDRIARFHRCPGDVSSAAFWVVAAAAMPGAHLAIRGVGLE